MTVALPIGSRDKFAYRRWPKFGDVIGHPEVDRRYFYLRMAHMGGHEVLVISAPGVKQIGDVVIVTDTNIAGAVILEEGPA